MSVLLMGLFPETVFSPLHFSFEVDQIYQWPFSKNNDSTTQTWSHTSVTSCTTKERERGNDRVGKTMYESGCGRIKLYFSENVFCL